MRDPNKHRLDVALEKDSDTLASLRKDAKTHQMSEQLGKMATIRLADYYLLCEQLGTYSVEGIVAALKLLSSWAVVVQAPAQHGDHVSRDVGEEASIAPAPNLEENVDAAVDVWGSM